MARTKQIDEPESKRRTKKSKEEETDNVIEEEQIIKKDKKNASKIKGKKYKKTSEADAEEDELSDLDLEEEDQTNNNNETNDEIIDSSKNNQLRERKIIDPKSQIGKLKPDEILSYLVQLGADTLNPQLKWGSLNLLKQLTGKRIYRPPLYGSKRNGPGNNFRDNNNNNYRGRDNNNNNNYRGRDNFNPKSQPLRSYSKNQSNQNGDLYNDN